MPILCRCQGTAVCSAAPALRPHDNGRLSAFGPLCLGPGGVGEKPSPLVCLGHCPFLPVWVGVGGICGHFLSDLFPFLEAQA